MPILPDIKISVRADTNNAETGFERVGAKAGKMGADLDRANLRTAAFGRGVQNAAFQVGDFAVQVGSGTDAARAMAQQLPQLLGGFGILGAVLGAAVAVAIPLRIAMQGLADDGRDLTEVFGTMQPVVKAVSEAFAFAGEITLQAAEIMVNNIDRIIAIGGTAAAFFAGKWVVGFVAARIATFSLSAALVTLRGAIIRTGIGALIVGAGEMVFQFSRLVQATGSFGAALGLLADLGKEVFGRLAAGGDFVVAQLVAGWRAMKATFLESLQSMVATFTDFTHVVADGINNLFGTNLTGLDSGLSWDLYFGAKDARAAADAALAEAAGAFAEFTAPLDSLNAIRQVLEGMKEDGITLDSLFGFGGDDDDDGKKLKEKLSEQEKAIKEHVDRIRALTEGGLGAQLHAWGGYFSNLVQLTGTSNDKLLGLAKSFAAAQTLINAWQAFGQVLADPTLPWFAKAAAAGQVLAAGIGAVNAIRSVSGSGAGGGGAAVSGVGAGAGAGAAPTVSRNVNISLTGGNMFSRESVHELINAVNEAVEDGATVRLS